MIPLFNTTPHTVASHAREMGFDDAAQLITPARSTILWDGKFGVDNCCYINFDGEKFLSLLDKLSPDKSRCIFVACPDVVGSARRTLECFSHWYPKLCAWPIAFVAQDGIENLDVPWRLFSCLFIGGTTAWKESKAAEDVIRAGKIIGKWVHIGRVNSFKRFRAFEKLQADSFDGTGVTVYREEREKFLRQRNKLNGENAGEELFEPLSH